MSRAKTVGGALLRISSFFFCLFPAFAQLAPNRYILLLNDPPVAERFAKREDMLSTAGTAYRAQLEARQRTIMADLASRRIQVTGSTATLINAIFVTAPASRVSEMLGIAGVAGVRPMHRFKPNLNAATQLMNAPAAWNIVGGQSNAGKGIKIGVLDSGIDQTHPAFQDSSLSMPAGFPKCDAVNQSVCSNFTNNKVIVARSYVPQLSTANVKDPNNPAAQSQPDDYTPRDRLGHGTAVASAAAANQNTGTVTFTGMAPHAWLGNYKIYGSPRVNDFFTDEVLIQALSDAMTDGMDIVNLSSGSLALTGAVDTGAACGLPAGQPCDPLAAAFEAAAQKGLVITVAVGNSGSDAFFFLNENYPYFNSISSPATAPSVIGVGATVNSHVLTPSVSVNDPNAPANLKGIAAVPSIDATFYPSAQGANQAPLIDITQLGNDGYACSALPAGSLTGAFALIQRGPASNPCTFDAKATNAQAAGAVGVVFYMYDSSTAISPSDPSLLGPAVMISNSDGLNLKNYIDGRTNQAVTIDLAGIVTNLNTYNTQEQLSPPVVQNQLASYTSFGPAPDGSLKPDLVATGGVDDFITFPLGGMYLAAQNFDPNGLLYSVNRYAAADGTSFASPLVAGAAALVKQAHPKYTAAQIKSALVNFSAQDTTLDDSGLPVNVQGVGAGRLDAGAAAGAAVGVQPATISFGYLKTGTTLPITKALTVTNPGSAAVTLAVAVAVSAASGATVAVDQTSLAVPAGGSATLHVSLQGSVPAPGAYHGQVTMQASGVSVHVPYLFLVGDGVPNNIIPYVGPEGVPGADTGASVVRVIDQYGVPVVGTSVTFQASSGTMVFNSVTGEPACTGSGSASVACNTDNYGFAYVDIVLGSTPGTPAINIKAGGLPLSANATILPAPAITPGQILDNAAFQPTIAPGSIIAIKGANLMDITNLVNSARGYDLSSTPFWEPVLDAVNVSFDVPGTKISVPAPVVAVSAAQIDVQVPWELAGQTSAQVKVIIDEEFGTPIYSPPVTATLSDYTPAFFVNSNIAAALDTNYKPINSSNPAVRGNFISLYANGLGPVTTPPADGFAPTANTNTTQPCTVTIGGQQVTPGFCGMPQGLAVYQVNIQVPTGISAGNQPVTITVGGKTSPTGVIIPVQ
jgi:minor extracellular serine protease Vpr